MKVNRSYFETDKSLNYAINMNFKNPISSDIIQIRKNLE